jgi:hypothetical protein
MFTSTVGGSIGQRGSSGSSRKQRSFLKGMFLIKPVHICVHILSFLQLFSMLQDILSIKQVDHDLIGPNRRTTRPPKIFHPSESLLNNLLSTYSKYIHCQTGRSQTMYTVGAAASSAGARAVESGFGPPNKGGRAKYVYTISEILELQNDLGSAWKG